MFDDFFGGRGVGSWVNSYATHGIVLWLSGPNEDSKVIVRKGQLRVPKGACEIVQVEWSSGPKNYVFNHMDQNVPGPSGPGVHLQGRMG